jgi:hypothetical protein
LSDNVMPHNCWLDDCSSLIRDGGSFIPDTGEELLV